MKGSVLFNWGVESSNGLRQAPTRCDEETGKREVPSPNVGLVAQLTIHLQHYTLKRLQLSTI
jgi:hypothetical protein